MIWAKDRVPLFVELKYGARFDPNLDGAVVQQIATHKMLDQVMLISFEHQALRRVKEREPNMATGVLYRTPVADPVGLAREIGANAIMPLYHLIAADDVALSHQSNLSVHAWGDGADYTALIAAGVDCINANHPAQARQKFLKERNGQLGGSHN